MNVIIRRLQISRKESEPKQGRMDRRNLAELLPFASELKLVRPIVKAPYMTVVGRDTETLAQEGPDRMKISKVFTQTFLQSYREAYNQGLLEISDREVGNKVKIARGCGHVIELADPLYVAEEVKAILQTLGWLIRSMVDASIFSSAGIADVFLPTSSNRVSPARREE